MDFSGINIDNQGFESNLMNEMKQLFDETDYSAEQDLQKLDYRLSQVPNQRMMIREITHELQKETKLRKEAETEVQELKKELVTRSEELEQLKLL